MNKFRLCTLAACMALASLTQAGDPTRPPSFAPAPVEVQEQRSSTLELQQIRMSGDKGTAVINGKLVKEGDSVDGARVVRITSDKVVVNIRKNLKTLSLIKRTKHSEK